MDRYLNISRLGESIQEIRAVHNLSVRRLYTMLVPYGIVMSEQRFGQLVYKNAYHIKNVVNVIEALSKALKTKYDDNLILTEGTNNEKTTIEELYESYNKLGVKQIRVGMESTSDFTAE